MYEHPRGLREVVPNQAGPQKCREFTLQTGGAQSTLQDIKLPDTAGGYSYPNHESSPILANRTIYWRTMGDVLELCEVSLNYSLVGGRVRYRFKDTPLLQGISLHEAWGTVVILVPTVGSVHKLTFPHPTRLEKTEQARVETGSLMSIFCEASAGTARECQHLLAWPASSPLPHTAATYYSQEEAVFVLANNQGQLTCVRLGGRVRGMMAVHQLAAPSSYLGRVWTSLTRAATAHAQEDQPQSLVIAPLGQQLLLAAVCRDHKVRVWSLTSYDCVLATDLVQFTAEAGQELAQGAQAHRISLVMQQQQGKTAELTLALYLCFQQHSQFLLVRLRTNAGQLVLSPCGTLYSPDHDLVSFAATETGGVTAVWTTSEGDTLVRRSLVGAVLASGGGGISSGSAGGPPVWETIVLVDQDQGSEEQDLVAESEVADVDPRQLYLSALFAPGAFRAATLARTVAFSRRNLESALHPLDETTSWDRLREEVVTAVESEIQNSLTDYEVTDEEYVAICRAAWSRFYSCAAQYRSAGRQPMGLVVSLTQSAVMMIRRDVVSWCRPVEALELVVITGGSGLTTGIFSDVPPLSDDPSLASDVLQLLVAAGMVGRMLAPGTVQLFSEAVSRLQSPDLVSKGLAAELLADQEQPHALQQILSRLHQIQDLARALEIVLYYLELDSGSVSRGELNLSGMDTEEPVPRVFAGPLGISLVAEALKQQVQSRMILSQQLLILQHLLMECGSSTGLGSSVVDKMQSTYLPRTTVMVHCYNALSWLTQVSASPLPVSIVEQGLRQMAVLKLTDKDLPGAARFQDGDPNNKSLLELFLTGPGRVVRGVVGECSSGEEDSWSRALPPLTNMVAQLLWPRCATPLFLNFLLRSCQHAIIQRYCRLLSTWCDWHPYARQFLLGSAYMNLGEEEKAVDLFLSAAGGVPQDTFLTQDLLNLTEGASGEDLSVEYFLKVISLLEQFPCPDLVIAMADTAISICPQDHKERATLSYILFSYHLKLGHNCDAYDAMVSNPDRRRRKDSLRQFLVTLFDRGELSHLASYPYIDMIDDVESIIESRARSADLSVNNYYDFLYSFHMSKENYRKASHVMYECGWRLSTELASLEGLRKQVQAYLAAINCLRLVNPSYRWLVKPSSGHPATSPKRYHNGEEKTREEAEVRGMEVVELVDMKRELLLSQARLKLTATAGGVEGSLPAGPGLTPAETVALLTAANLYVYACEVCHEFGLPVSGVVEGLTGRAVRLSNSRPLEQSAAWQWLAENRTGGADIQGDCAVSAAWNLLQHIVITREKPGETVLHRVITTRLFTLGSSLPPWLLASYKKKNFAELLRLYHGQGLIEKAADLAVEYLQAVMGNGTEYFGLESSLQASGRAAWVPWTALDRLFMELSDNLDIPAVAKARQRLESTLEKYLHTVERVSHDMIANRA